MTGFAENKLPPYAAPMTKAAFLRWVQGRPGRFELKDGRVVMQAGGSRHHAIVIGRLVGLLSSRLDPELWNVVRTELAVEVADDIRYPDLLIERANQSGDALSATEPIVLVEVLLPSSVGTDMTIKLSEYTSLPSLEGYVVASQDEPICWVWQRAGEARAFPAIPMEIKGQDSAIGIAALGVALPLADVYRGIGPR